MKYLYRFRTIESLLGNNSRTGELEGQYIYFAAPSQLNDPLEGYREIYWSGDRIVWMNLFRHYTLCLLQTVLHDALQPDKPESDIKKQIRVMYSDVSPEMKKLTDQALTTAIATNNIDRHISLLSKDNRQVRIDELRCTLTATHFIILDAISKASIQAGVISHNRYNIPDTYTASNTYLNMVESLYAHYPDRITEINEIVAKELEKTEFQHRFTKNKLPTSATQIYFSFPGEFCEAISELNFPEWYVSCFMEEPKDSSIWGSYGANHTAACLIFNIETKENEMSLALELPSYKNQKGYIYKLTNLPFKKVDYDAPFTEIDFFRSIGNRTHDQLMTDWYMDSNDNTSECANHLQGDTQKWIDDYWKNYMSSICVKIPDWRKESEYRLLLSSTFFDYSPPKERCIKYNFSSLAGIIFGIKTNYIEKIKIIKIITKLCKENNRENFDFYNAKYNHKTREIEYNKLSIDIQP